MFYKLGGRRGHDRMEVGFTTTCTSVPITTKVMIEFESRSCQGALDTTWCDNVCQWLAGGR